MSNSALIEDLERQFNENPRRVFARLANEYRKSGNLEGAIALCREHVPRHPGYISGHIVLGQALFESGDAAEARSSFEAALQLDPENLIALRHLGDIARQSGELDEARGWYRRLLEVDPQNEEAAAQLDMMDVGSQPTPVMPIASVPEVAPEVAAEEAPQDEDTPEPISWSDIHPESPTVPESSSATADAPAVDVAEAFPAIVDQPTDAASEGEGAEELEFTDADFALPRDVLEQAPAADVSLDLEMQTFTGELPGARDGAPSAAPVEGLESVTGIFDQGNFSPGDIVQESDPFADPTERSGPVEFEMPAEEIVTLAENVDRTRDAGKSADDLGLDWPEGDRAGDRGIREVTLDYPEPDEHDAPAAEVRLPEGDGEAAPAFVTETVAELYERQGHLAQSLDVYRQLSGQNPENDALRMHVERLERELAAAEQPRAGAQSIRSIFSRVLANRPRSMQERPANSLFPGMATAPADDRAATALANAFSAPAPGAAAEHGRPARTADDELSLDSVFRNGAPGRTDGNGGVSFDEFFPNGAGGTQQPQGDATDAPDGDDETFHSWLDGLKR